jgi:hypothetical protein
MHPRTTHPLANPPRENARATSVRDVLSSRPVMENHCHERADQIANGHYDVRVWTFAKGADELTVEQWVEGGTVMVTLTRAFETGQETVQEYEFSDQSAAEQFHANLDKAMLEFGWSFVGYLPQRRSHDDRRQRLRTSDRRRWWTDGALILD